MSAMGFDELDDDDDFDYLALPEVDVDYFDDDDTNNISANVSASLDVCRVPFSRVHEAPEPFDSNERRCFLPGQKIQVQIKTVEYTPHSKLLNPNLYVITLTHGEHEWVIKRRYKHFHHLHDQLVLYRTRLKIPMPMRAHRQRRKSFATRRQILPRFPRKPDGLVKAEEMELRKMLETPESVLSNFMKQLEEYLQDVLRSPQFRNHHETLKFLGVSHLSFVNGLGQKRREGMIRKRSGGRQFLGGCCQCLAMCSQSATAHWNKRWLMLRDTYVAVLNPDTGRLSDVMLMDETFEVQAGLVRTGCKTGLLLSNLTRNLLIKCWTPRKTNEWKEAIIDASTSVGRAFSTPNRYNSFAPVRINSSASWFVDAAQYMNAVADAIEEAKEEIFITDWWLSPEIYMKRPMTEGDRWRLDVLLKRKADEGVHIFVMLFKEMEMALGINSYYTKQALLRLHHTNIRVMRHPDGISLWSHHEKCVVIDQSVAFLGGVDLCYGRWDTPSHRLTDLGSVMLSPTGHGSPGFPSALSGGLAPPGGLTRDRGATSLKAQSSAQAEVVVENGYHRSQSCPSGDHNGNTHWDTLHSIPELGKMDSLSGEEDDSVFTYSHQGSTDVENVSKQENTPIDVIPPREGQNSLSDGDTVDHDLKYSLPLGANPVISLPEIVVEENKKEQDAQYVSRIVIKDDDIHVEPRTSHERHSIIRQLGHISQSSLSSDSDNPSRQSQDEPSHADGSRSSVISTSSSVPSSHRNSAQSLDSYRKSDGQDSWDSGPGESSQHDNVATKSALALSEGVDQIVKASHTINRYGSSTSEYGTANEENMQKDLLRLPSNQSSSLDYLSANSTIGHQSSQSHSGSSHEYLNRSFESDEDGNSSIGPAGDADEKQRKPRGKDAIKTQQYSNESFDEDEITELTDFKLKPDINSSRISIVSAQSNEETASRCSFVTASDEPPGTTPIIKRSARDLTVENGQPQGSGVSELKISDNPKDEGDGDSSSLSKEEQRKRKIRSRVLALWKSVEQQDVSQVEQQDVSQPSTARRLSRRFSLHGLARKPRPPNLDLRAIRPPRNSDGDGSENLGTSTWGGLLLNPTILKTPEAGKFLGALLLQSAKPSTPKPRRRFAQKAHEIKLEIREKFKRRQSQAIDISGQSLDPELSLFRNIQGSMLRKPEDVLEEMGLEGSTKLWIGKDYTNFIFRDFVDLDKPFTDFIDRTTTPRMPWHDIGAVVYGKAARDVARHFIQRWNFTKVEKRKTNSHYPLLLPKSYTKVPFLAPALRTAVSCTCQILRSASDWSAGISRVESSIHNAYLDIIQNAKHYIYIENQFFVSIAHHDVLENSIADALFHRIQRAHKSGENFRVFFIMPLLPAFEGELGTNRGTSIQAVTHWNYSSICRGGKSLLERLSNEIGDPTPYITFYGLRTHGELMGNVTTELVYVHSKLMIVDDNTVIIGSANINDRSMMGKRDTELAVVVHDTRTIKSIMDGKEYQAGWYASSLRKTLFREHLGLGESDTDIEISDPVDNHFYKEIWLKQASVNTSVYEKVFQCIPTDSVRNFAHLKEYQAVTPMAQTNPEKARELLAKVKGHLVMMPLMFLCDVNLQPTVGTKEALAPTIMWT